MDSKKYISLKRLYIFGVTPIQTAARLNSGQLNELANCRDEDTSKFFKNLIFPTEILYHNKYIYGGLQSIMAFLQMVFWNSVLFADGLFTVWPFHSLAFLQSGLFADGLLAVSHWSICWNIPRKPISVKYHGYISYMHPIRLSISKTSSINYQRPNKATKRSKKATVDLLKIIFI